MEAALTPIQKALRKYGSGRPPAAPKDTPLAAVALATEQRSRLRGVLQQEGLSDARIERLALVIRAEGAPPDILADAVLVLEGKESEAVAQLEMYHAIGKRYTVVGIMFAVREASSAPILFAYPIDRTPSGVAAVRWSYDRQMSGAVKRPD